MLRNGRWDHNLTVKSGKEAVPNPTEHGHLQVNLYVVVKCPKAPSVISTERAKSSIQRDHGRMPVNGHVPVSVHLAHARLGYQVMEANVLVIPIVWVPPIHNLAIAVLYHPDEVQRLNDQGTWREHPGRSIAV